MIMDALANTPLWLEISMSTNIILRFWYLYCVMLYPVESPHFYPVFFVQKNKVIMSCLQALLKERKLRSYTLNYFYGSYNFCLELKRPCVVVPCLIDMVSVSWRSKIRSAPNYRVPMHNWRWSPIPTLLPMAMRFSNHCEDNYCSCNHTLLEKGCFHSQ